MKRIITILCALALSVSVFAGSPKREFRVDVDVPAWDFGQAVAEGALDGLSAWGAYGYNPNIGTEREDIWDAGGTYSFITTSATLYVVCTTTTANQSVEVIGLDENWNAITTSVTLNGQTAVAVDGLWSRVNRVQNTGSSDIEGDTYAFTTATVTAGVPATGIKAKIVDAVKPLNQTNHAIYSVPAGYTAYITGWYGAVGLGDGARVGLFVQEIGGAGRMKAQWKISANGFRQEMNPPMKVPAKSDIWVCGTADAASTPVAAGFDVVLVRD